MTSCDKIISFMDIVSTKMTNTIPTNVSVNSDNKKVRYQIDCYILHIVVTRLLLVIIIIYYYYAKRRSKQKTIYELTI